MWKITVAQEQAHTVSLNEDKALLIDNQIFEWDLQKLNNRTFHAIKDNKNYTIEVVEADTKNKTFSIRLNGKLMDVTAKDRFDLLLEKMGMSDMASQKISELKAPMPGLVLDVSVEVGQQVKEGEMLLILEAMKMENVLKAPADVVIKALKIEKGVNVEKNQVLIEFE
ncbi:MAG: biotin/lipoyl-binding protein [Bernardetiaceae bacterium]|nr:biotin/lipoyl-binding protein [Bernardetiaceae bacterium]